MDLFEAHNKCWNDVIANGYYVDILHSLYKEHHSVLNTRNEIKSFWSDFWYELPDSKSIHRKPFDLICSICEGEFDE